MKPGRILIAVLVASLAGCVLPMTGGRSTAGNPTAHPAADAVAATQMAATQVAAAPMAAADTAAAAPPIVQVRDFWRSSVVSVVAWDADEARIGLRADVSRNGILVGGRRGDHLLFLHPFYVWYMGGFVHATAEPGKPLLHTGVLTDSFNCFYGGHCSPMTIVGVRLPDSLLRAKRDSLIVTFLPGGRDPWNVTLRRELIEAYLTRVDAVVAQMR